MRVRDIKSGPGWWYVLRVGIGEVTAVDQHALRVTVKMAGGGRRWVQRHVDAGDVLRIAKGEEVAEALTPPTHLGTCGACWLGIIIDSQTLEVQRCDECAGHPEGFGCDDDAAQHLLRVLGAVSTIRNLLSDHDGGADLDREELEEAYRQLRVLTRIDSKRKGRAS